MNLYRLLLKLAPRRLRDRHAADMEAVFRDHLAAARQQGRLAAAVVWFHAIRDIALSVALEPLWQWRRRGRVGIVTKEERPS